MDYWLIIFLSQLLLFYFVRAHLSPAYTFKTEEFEKPNKQKWMAQLDGSKRLNELSIPGTHDSCAGNINYQGLDGWKSTINSYAIQTQALDIRQQLEHGIRFMDIRVGLRSSATRKVAFGIYHDVIFLDQWFDEVLEITTQFLVQNPTEIVLMRVKQDHDPEIPIPEGKSNDQILEQTLKEYIETERYTNFFWDADIEWQSISFPTLSSLRGKIVLLVNFHSEGNYGLNYGNRSLLNIKDVSKPKSLYTKWEDVKQQLHGANDAYEAESEEGSVETTEPTEAIATTQSTKNTTETNAQSTDNFECYQGIHTSHLTFGEHIVFENISCQMKTCFISRILNPSSYILQIDKYGCGKCPIMDCRECSCSECSESYCNAYKKPMVRTVTPFTNLINSHQTSSAADEVQKEEGKKMFINYLSANTMEPGSWNVINYFRAPFFYASGHNLPSSGQNRRAIGPIMADDCSTFPNFPKVNCISKLCTLVNEGTNVLTFEYLRTHQFSYVGVVVADFPGQGLIDEIIAVNFGTNIDPAAKWEECNRGNADDGILSQVGTIGKNAWETIPAMANDFIDASGNVIHTVGESVKGGIEWAGEKIGLPTVGKAIGTGVGATVESVGKVIVQTAPRVIKTAHAVISKGFEWTGKGVEKIGELAKSAVKIGGDLVEKVKEAGSTVIEGIGNAASKVGKWFSNHF